MSYTKTVTVWCDVEGCNEWDAVGTNRVKRARKVLRGHGWSCKSGGPDYCPEHAD